MDPKVDEICIQLLIQTMQGRNTSNTPRSRMVCWQRRISDAELDKIGALDKRHAVIKRMDGAVDCLEHIYGTTHRLKTNFPRNVGAAANDSRNG